MDEDVVVLILNTDEEGKLSENGRLELSRSLHQVLESFERYCSLTVSVFVSEAAMNLRELPYIYKDALDLSNDRLKYGHRCMLFREDRFADSPQSFPIDHPLVEQLLAAIKEGKQEYSGWSNYAREKSQLHGREQAIREIRFGTAQSSLGGNPHEFPSWMDGSGLNPLMRYGNPFSSTRSHQADR
ncbi:hypothetical protein NSU08_32220 [Paenibacillus sp. FSL H7-0331]|uniref:hypothetical protein n=1 Tax=Paenibacillus sp. FSL H7-0331 TaxID=1920421 RepID=UPI00096D2756|nr:hypothetical protein BK127_26900 [Paenibacillus sp. FSL H7-0331]